jgi:DNA-binding PadR family transcriptional regulator
MLSKVAILVLGIIAEEPINPYAIGKVINYKRENIKKLSNVSASTIYGIINTLQKEKLISGKKSKNGNMPDRTIYSITEKGRGLLRETLISLLSNPEDTLSELTLSALLINHLDSESILKALNNYNIEINRQIRIRKKLLKEEEDRGVSYTGLIALNHNLRVLKVNLKTVNELIDSIAKDTRTEHYPVPFWIRDIVENEEIE